MNRIDLYSLTHLQALKLLSSHAGCLIHINSPIRWDPSTCMNNSKKEYLWDGEDDDGNSVGLIALFIEITCAGFCREISCIAGRTRDCIGNTATIHCKIMIHDKIANIAILPDQITVLDDS